MWTSELETTHYLATTDTIHDCISGAATWVENRKALREVASDFTKQDKLLVCPTHIQPFGKISSSRIGDVRYRKAA